MGLKRKMPLCLNVCKIQGSLAWLRGGILIHSPLTSPSHNQVISHLRDPAYNQNLTKSILLPCIESLSLRVFFRLPMTQMAEVTHMQLSTSFPTLLPAQLAAPSMTPCSTENRNPLSGQLSGSLPLEGQVSGVPRQRHLDIFVGELADVLTAHRMTSVKCSQPCIAVGFTTKVHVHRWAGKRTGMASGKKLRK